MNFEYSDDQRMLRDTLERFVADRYSFDARRAHLSQPDGWSRVIWVELAELGVLSLPFAVQDGGLGGGGIETMIVTEALGKGLVVEPYFATVILAGGLLTIAGNAAQRADRVARIGAGDHVMAVAFGESGLPRHAPAQARTRATCSGDRWVLKGAKTAVLHGDCADELIVTAATDEGLSLFLVATDVAGIDRNITSTYDGRRVADIGFSDVELPKEALLGAPGGASALLARLEIQALAALAAEAVGAMSLALDTTTDYLRTRQQFGVPIGSFQALQHRAVDMLIALEQARSIVILAALTESMPLPERQAIAAAAKVQVGRSGRFIGQQAVQLHGAIGLTDEYVVGHAFKRLTAIDALFGDADHHLDAIAHAGGLPA